MTDYTTEQRKADAETLRRHVYAAPGAESGVTRDDLRAIADRLDPAPPPMTLRETVAVRAVREQVAADILAAHLTCACGRGNVADHAVRIAAPTTTNPEEGP